MMINFGQSFVFFDKTCMFVLLQSMVLEGHHGAVKCVAYSPDGKTLASTGDIHVAIICAMPSATAVCVYMCVFKCYKLTGLLPS